jgi:hypothetical protein
MVTVDSSPQCAGQCGYDVGRSPFLLPELCQPRAKLAGFRADHAASDMVTIMVTIRW